MQLNPAISASVAAAAASVVGLLPSQELQGIDASGIPLNPLHRALHKYGLDPSGVPLKMTNPNEISEAFKAQEQEKLRVQAQAQLAQAQAQMAKAQADAKAQVQAQAKEAERLRLKEITDPVGFAEEKRRKLEMEEILAKVAAAKAAAPVYVEAVAKDVDQEAERLRLKEISDPVGFAEEKRRKLEMEEILAKVAAPVYVEAVDQPVVQPSIFRPPLAQPALFQPAVIQPPALESELRPVANLEYDDAVDTSAMKKVLFIDSNVKAFQNYANAETFPIIYDHMCTREQMLELLSKKFTNISRIAFVSHFSESPHFLNQESLFSEANKQFAVDIIRQFHVSNVDYLACSTLVNADWSTYYSALQEKTGVIIGASDNNTGNIKYGGDWILESTHEDIHVVYFNDQIQDYSSLLDTIVIDGLIYTTDGTNATLVGYNSNVGTNVTIPATITDGTNTYNVIGALGAIFMGYTNLTSVTIPNTITSLTNTFYNCTGLTSITIPSSVTKIADAFNGCINLSSVTFDSPSSLTIIENYSFYNCSSLNNITIPNSVTSIGPWSVFSGCTGLESVILPNSLTSMGGDTFTNCTSLTSINIPSLVTILGTHCFASCTSLTTITFASPCNINTIVHGIINGCTSLTSFTIPASVTNLSNNAFSYYHGSISVDPANTTFASVDGILFNADLTALVVYFDSPTRTSYTIPNSVTGVLGGIFMGCTNLTSVTMPNTITELNSSFNGCINLTSITIPSSVTKIADAFNGCINLSSVTFDSSSSLTIIENYSFNGCISLKTITLPNSVTSIGPWSVFSGCTGLESVILPNSITSMGGDTFTNCTSLTSINIPSSVTNLGGQTFANCTSLITLVIPASVTNIAYAALYGFSNLAKVYFMGSDIPTISDGANANGATAYYIAGATNTSALSVFATQTSVADEAAITAAAAIKEFIVSGVRYLTTSSSTAKATGHVGSNTIVTIPSSIGQYNVTEIENYVFMNKNLTSIVFESPSHVTRIGNQAFGNCQFTSITIPNSVTHLGSDLFNGCGNLTTATISNSVTSLFFQTFCYCSSLTSVVFASPSSVTTIDYRAFGDSTSLTSITIPASVTSLNGGAFNGCNVLTSINIDPANTSFVSDGAAIYDAAMLNLLMYFSNNVRTSYTIPSSVTNIGHAAFANSIHLTSLTIPSSVVNISSRAFQGSAITSVQISSSVTNIGDSAFLSSSISSITFDSPCSLTSIESWVFASSGITSIIIPDSVTTIGNQAFGGCAIASITIPNSVTHLGSDLFNSCASLRSITIPSSVTGTIGFQTFGFCTNLVNVQFASPCNVTYIDNGAFASCTSLTQIDIPSSVTSIGGIAFSGCTNLAKVYFMGSDIPSFTGSIEATAYYIAGATNASRLSVFATQTSFPDEAAITAAAAIKEFIVSGVRYITTSSSTAKATGRVGSNAIITIPSSIGQYNVTEIVEWSLTSLNSTSVIFESPSHVTSIGVGAFNGSISLTSIIIPNSVTNMGQQCFQGCTALTSITIGTGVTNITDMFGYDAALTSVTFASPSSVTTIGAYTFYVCSSLASITIPSSVTSFGQQCFHGCTALTSISYDNPTFTSFGNYMFNGCTGLTSANIPASVTNLGNNTFNGCTGITSVTIPASVNNLGTAAFSGCTNVINIYIDPLNTLFVADDYGVVFNSTFTTILMYPCGNTRTSYTIPNTVTSVGGAFGGSNYLINVIIPNSVTSIDNHAFHGCENITSVNIPSSVKSIGQYAFFDCRGVMSINIPSSVTSMGQYAFYRNSSAVGITFSSPCSITSIGDSIFEYCTSVISVVIPDSVTSIGYGAFGSCAALQNITIGSGVTFIHTDAFAGDNLTNVSFSGTSSLTDIPNWMLGNNHSRLKNVTIPSSVTHIGYYVFIDSTSLAKVYFMGSDIPIIHEANTNAGTAYYIAGATNTSALSVFAQQTSVADEAALIALMATPTISSLEAGDHIITINFTEGPYAGTLNYKYSTDNGTTWTSRDPVSRVSPIVVTGLAYGEYAVKIMAVVDGDNDSTAISNSQSVTLLAPTEPDAPTITNVVPDSRQATITFTAGAANRSLITNYKYSTDNGATFITRSPASTSSPIVVTGLTNGTAYNVVLKAVNAIGDSVPSNSQSVTPNATPGPTFIVDGITYTPYLADQEAIITGGAGRNGATLTIPSTISDGTNTYNVIGIANWSLHSSNMSSLIFESPSHIVRIGDYAFHNCTSLTSIDIPNSVTNISEYAFNVCAALASVTFASPSSLQTIGYRAFVGCALTSISLPDSITSTGWAPFSGCPITSFTIPDALTNLDCLGELSVLSSIVFGSGITNISDWSLNSKTNLTSITIPSQVTNIGSFAFANCTSLASVTFETPISVTNIGDIAFLGCALTSITIPASVATIGSQVFSGCNALQNIFADPSSTTFASTDGVLFNATLTAIIAFPPGKTAYTIPESVTSIGASVFSNATNLTSITIPDSVISIGEFAFASCSGLTSITIPTSVTSIGNHAFTNLTTLASVTFEGPSSLASIGNGGFSNNPALTSIVLPNSVTSIGEFAFGNNTALTSITLSDSLISIGGWAFQGCTALTSIALPDSLISIGDEAFQGCTALTSLTIPASVTSIGLGALLGSQISTIVVSASNTSYAAADGVLFNKTFTTLMYFSNNKTSYVIPSSVTSISQRAFQGCSNLTSIILPASLISIGGWAFHTCSNITSIVIPNSVTSIGDWAFEGCPISKFTIPDAITNISCIQGMIVNHLTIGRGITSIPDWIFYNASNFQTIEFAIPSSCTSIGNYAFTNNSNLKSVILPDSANIGAVAFANCPLLTNCVIPDSVSSIGDSAFGNCPLLTNFTIPNSITNTSCLNGLNPKYLTIGTGITNIPDWSLTNMTNLISLRFASPSSLTSIASWSIYNNSLASVSIPSSVTSMGGQVFWNCPNLSVVYFMGSDIPMRGGVFSGCPLSTAYYLDGATNVNELSIFPTIVPLSSADLLAASEAALAALATAPEAPIVKEILAGDTTATINFLAGGSNGSAISNYKYSTDDGANWTTLEPASTSSPIVISGLTNGQTYQVKLRAVNAQGDGVASSAQSVTPAAGGPAAEATAPAAPTITSITAGDQSASIAFTAGSSNGSTITNYKYSCVADGEEDAWITRSPASTSSPIVVSGLTNGQLYQVKLKAVNAMGESDASSAQSVTPAASAFAPAAPTITSITAGDQSASVAFTAGSDNGAAITNYQYSTDNGYSWTTLDPSATTSPIIISGLTNGQIYQVQLKAMNAQGAGTASEAQSVTPVAAPETPTIIELVAGDQSATIKFTDGADNGSAILSYQYSTDNGTSWTTLDASAVDFIPDAEGPGHRAIHVSNLTNGEVYQVKLKATNAQGTSAATEAQSVTPVAAPAKPTITNLTAGDKSATINFTDGSNNGSAITSYQYSIDNGTSWTTLDASAVESNTIYVSNLTNGETYDIKLRAVNIIGASEETASQSVTPVAAPETPTIISIVAGDQSAIINFTDGFNNGSAISSYQYSITNGESWVTLDPLEVDTLLDASSVEYRAIYVSELTNGDTYLVKIRAVNAQGASEETSTQSVTPVAAPAAPTITDVTAGDQSLSVAFTAGSANGSAITNYQYSTDNGANWTILDPSATASPITISGLSNGQTYQVQLKAMNAQGASSASAAQSGMPVAAPAAPTITDITAGDQSATINFTAGSDNGSTITNYQYSTNNGDNWTTLDPASTSNSITISDLTNGQTYQVKLRAVNAIGEGVASTAQSVKPAAAPAAPTITSITAGNQSASVAFTAGSDNGSAITNYKYSYVVDGEEDVWTTLDPASASSPILISSLVNGVTYQVKIKAVNAVGSSVESNALSVKPMFTPTAPTITEVLAGDQSASITFTAGETNGSDITNYQYSATTSGTAVWTTLDPQTTSSPIAISSLTNGQTYFIKLRAVNEVGAGETSNTIQVKPVAAPAAPTILSITGGDHNVSINYTAGSDNGSAVTSYQYSCSLDGSVNWITIDASAATSPIVVSGLTNGQTYQVKLKAVNAIGESTESNELSGMPVAAPDAPTITSITAGNQSASVAFTPNFNNGSAITNYEYSTDDGANWTIRSPVSTTSPMTISGLTNGQTYQVKIKAVNAIGSSVESSSESVMPVAEPASPTIVRVDEEDQSLSIVYTANSDNGSAITSYQYSINDGANWTILDVSAAASPIVVSNLTNGQTYLVKLNAVNAIGASETLTSISVTPSTNPVAPIITGITSGDQTASIAFTAGSDNGAAITNYHYSTDNGANWTALSPAATSSLILLTELENGKTFSIKLKALNRKGLSNESNALSATPAGLPISPTIYNIIAGDGSAIVNFTAGFNNGSELTNYQYSKNNGTSWTPLDPSATTSPITISGLTNGQSYPVKIKAVNAIGASTESNALSVTPIAPPAAPTITTASVGDSTATFTITANATNGSAITNYKYSIDNGEIWTERSPASTASSLVLTELENGKTYAIIVKAVNAAGDSVASSPAQSVTPAGLPFAPIIDTAVAGDRSITINFSANFNNGSAITTYKHAYSSNSGSTWSAWTQRTAGTSESPLVVTGLTNGQSYLVKIRAVNAKGDSVDSNQSSSVMPIAPPDAPTLTGVTTGDSTITINFSANANNGSAITNYLYSLDNGSNWTERSPASTTTSIVLLELENGASYSVKLIAVNAAGNSVASNVITVILAGPPDAPTITGVTGGDRSINVAFNANADNDSPITTYQHSYSSDSGSTWSAWTQRSTGTTASPLLISGLINAQTYLVKLKAVNVLGASVESSQSSPVMAVAAPEAPTITGVVAGDRSVSIAFDPSFNNGSAITGYQYSYTSNSGSSWSAWETLGESATSPLVATGLTNGQNYQVKIKAVNAVGAGAESAQSSSFKPVSAPAKPTITGVTAGALSVSIDFTAGFDNGSDITTYEYAYSSNDGSSWSDWNARSAGTTASPLIATGLLNGTTYVLKIRAVNAIGSGADSDQSSSAKPVDVPTAPIINGEISAGDRGATIAFTAAFNNGLDITTYQYKYSSDSELTWSEWATRNLGSTASPLIVSGLLNGTTYSMKIRAVNALGGGIESSAKQVMPVSEPAEPTITGVTAGPASVKIALTAGFDNGSAITSYQFQSSINSGTSWSEWGTCSSGESASQVIATGLLNGTAYVVRIRAVNAIGAGAVSGQSSSVTPVDTPSAPTILNTSTTGDKIITIIFAPPSTNNGLAITNYRYSTNNGVDWTERTPSNLTSPIVITTALANGTTTPLANGTIYPVIIAAKNSLGYGTSSEIMNLKPKSAPGAPTITDISPANARAIINFTGAFDNGADITNYKYSIDAGKTWNTLLPKVTSSPIVIATGLTNGKLYNVKILAINAIGMGVQSNTFQVTPIPGVPFEPIISTIVGGNNTATINVIPGNTNGSAITNYRYSVNGVWTTLSPAVPSPKTILVPGLTNGQSYTITLKALNVVGEGSESLSKSVVPAGPPFAPTITGITRGNASAIINFDPSYNNGSAITNYKFSTAPGKWTTCKVPPTNNQILVEALKNATMYSMQIAAISERWPTGGAVSNTMSVIPAGAPALPKISKITAGDRRVNFTFTAGANNGSAILGYKYAYTSDSGANWSTWTSSNWTAGDASMNIVDLTNGTLYSVKLRAVNAVGDGVESVASLAARPFGAPYAPTITSIVRGNTSALVYFDASGSNGSPINKYSYSLDNGAWKASTYKVGDAAIIITALKNGQTYSIRIRALSVAFIAGGEPSNALSVTPATLAVAPKITTMIGGDHSATINFTAGANNGSAITNYMYSLDGSTNWVTLDPASTTSPIIVQNLTNGQAYPIKLKAINDVGVSLLSNAVPAVIPAGPPTAPTINSETSVRGDKSLTINFTAGNGNGVNIAGYVCSYSSDSGATWTRVAIALVPNQSTISLTKLTNGTTYSVKLQATSSRYLAGGDYSNIVTIKPAGVPSLPSIPAVGGATIGNQTATITFNSVDANGSPITNYKYLMNTGLTWTDVSGTWVSLNASDVLNNSIVLSGLTNAVKYNLRLRATNDVGDGLLSSVVSFTPDIVSGAPSISSVSASKGLVSIVFVAPVVNNGTAVVNYAYAYSSNDGATWTTITPTTKSVKTPIVTTKLLAGTYSIKIMAINGRGASEDSNIKTIVVV